MGYTTHDRRFVCAAVDGGWKVHYARFDGGASDLVGTTLPEGAHFVEWLGATQPFRREDRGIFIQDFIRLGERYQPTVVHAGPIPTVASVAVAAQVAPVIAMSWASDLLVDAASSKEIASSASVALRNAHAVVVDCSTVRERAEALGADPNRIISVPWGVELERFPHVAMPPRRAGEVRLLCVRSHEPLYDVETLLRAVHAVAVDQEVDVHLDLAGSGSLTEHLRSLASELGIGSLLTWHGRVDEGDVQRLLAAAHVHVSTALSDGSSISMLQAMATGRPTIATAIPSNREWIQDGVSGWLFKPGDASDLARAIVQAASLGPDLAGAGDAARHVAVLRADWVRNRSEIINCYSAVGTRRAAPTLPVNLRP